MAPEASVQAFRLRVIARAQALREPVLEISD